MSNGKIPDHLADQLARAIAHKIDYDMHTVSTHIGIPRKLTKGSTMPGKYDIYDENDLPEDMRKLMQEKEDEVIDKLMLPKKMVEKQHMTDTIEALKRQMEIEREKFEKHDPVQRELRDLRNEVEHLKQGMRKIGVLLDTDLPDQEAFDQFKGLRKAYGKYKMVEKLTLGENDDV